MLHDTIRALCDEAHISITDLEKGAGLGNGTVGKWKTAQPNLATLQKVADFLKVPISKLIQ